MTQVAQNISNDISNIWEKLYPKNLNWHLDIPAKPLFSMLDETVLKYGDRPAFSFLKQEYSYAEISKVIDHVACGLQKMGVKKGIKIGLFMPNTSYSIIVYFGILKTGATVVNYNPLYSEPDLINQIEDSHTDIMVTLDVETLFTKVDNLMDKTCLDKMIICPMQASLSDTPETRITEASDTHIWFDTLINNDGIFKIPAIDPENDIAVLQYTGGTTGVPKGAALSHKNLYANTIQIGTWFNNIEPGQDAQVAALPFFHVFAMTVVMNMSIMNGMKIHIMPQFDLKEALTLIHEEKPQYFAAVPTIYNALGSYAHIKDYDFSSLKFCLSGGAPLPSDVKRLFEEKTGAKRVAEGYGLTECSPVATCNPVSGNVKVGSIGMPLPGTMIDIIDPKDGVTILPIGEKGEVCVSGPQVMKSYYNKDEATLETIKNGRLHTGDIGYIDDEGYVYLVDRIKDLILVRGYNVYPRHVEEAIYKHPSVAECIVAGVPDKARGENVQAWVKPVDGAELSSSDIKDFIKGKLSPTELPRKIIIRTEPLPKTAVGKLSRKDLLEQEGIS